MENWCFDRMLTRVTGRERPMSDPGKAALRGSLRTTLALLMGLAIIRIDDLVSGYPWGDPAGLAD